ncbi:HAMP domain-containing sensor histidine kinase [Hymenobacter terricola]|uniref:HAMP domain-containing sensor histidine kinase n=1 Tax=Hymenobacter terricola TaxID=2819236 RepID=UPI001B3092F9|nr:ATP-binding protein [Hymenobacter terricola]
MNIKSKITVGFLALLGLLIILGSYAHYTVQQLDSRSRSVLQDNFYSVQLGQDMLVALDEAEAQPTSPEGLPRFHYLLSREAGNVTEPGERPVVDSLTRSLAQLSVANNAAALAQLRQLTHRMVQLNMQAVARKDVQANRAAGRAGRYLLTFIVLSIVVALGFVLSIPEAAVSGLHKLTASMAHAAQGDFTASIPVESRDEFGQVASSFNQLLVQVNDARTSNLAGLMTERNRVTSIVQTLDEALLLLDENQRILVANPPACALLELPESEVVGADADDLAARSPLMQQLLAVVRAPASQRKAAVPLALMQRGEELHYRLMVHDAVSFNAPLDKMEFVGTILALHNVSDFKRLDQTKSNFLATVSHELKTPLSTINFHLKLLQNLRVGPLNAEQQQIVESLKQENQRLLKLTHSLLDVSKLESGVIPLNLRTTAVAELLAYATDPIQLQLAPKHLTLEIDLPPDLPPVLADREKTAWVLLNLLANAVRYSPEAGRITVSAARAIGGEAVEVRVQDRGPGIEPEYQEHIFQRFAQAPDAVSTAQDGSGLGLSISHEFITTQGGLLGVHSAPGAGSTFFFTLPLAT